MILCCLWLAACSTSTPRPAVETSNPLLQQAQLADQNGQTLQAARLYEQLAMQSASPAQEDFLANAIDAYLRAQDFDSATRLTQWLTQNALDPQRLSQAMLRLAEIQLNQGRTEPALDTLGSVNPKTLSQADRIQYQQLLGEAFFQTGNLLESARARVGLDALLTDTDLKLANQQSILDTLMLLSDQALTTLKPAPPDPLRGWMELALLMRSNPGLSASDPAFATWRVSNPQQAINTGWLEQLLSEQTQLALPMASVAVLLPESGPFAGAAQAIRTGLVTAALSQAEPRPQLRFYDTETAPIDQVYATAVLDGAEAVIGPLDKDRVYQLSQLQTFERPVLALNQAAALAPTDFFQFALSPEEEAEQIASLAWLNGHISALILTPQSEYGQRVARHFVAVWTGLGGKVQDVQAYRPEDADHSNAIRNLLKLNESVTRYRTLVNRLNVPIEFEERRRHDADFIFLLATPDSARLIKPQLRFHRAADLPVYATSSVFTGATNTSADIDLDDVIFCDMPWLIDPNDSAGTPASEWVQLWPDLSQPYKRLFSFGLDALSLLPHLNQMQQRSTNRLRGQTGILRVDAKGRIKRQLTCAEFQRGAPQSIGLAPSLNLPEINRSEQATDAASDAVTTPLSDDRLPHQPASN